MKPELLKVYESIPADTPRSRLEPYRELILRWRRQGRTYRRIQALLVDQFAVRTSHGMLFKFVCDRSKPRKAKAEPDLNEAETSPTAESKRDSQIAADPYAEARERMRLFKEAPVAAKPRKVFEVPEEDLDGTKPLRMMKPNQPKEK